MFFTIFKIQYVVSILDRLRRTREPKTPQTERRTKTFASAAKFQAERQKLNQIRRTSARSAWWNEHKAPVLIGIAFAAVLTVIIGAVIALRGAAQFKIEKIVVRGNQVAKQEQILEAINWVKDQNLYALNVRQVQQDLMNKFPYFKQVQVRKVLPNNVLVEITERAAVMTYINISTAITVDAEGRVIAVFDAANLLPLSDEIMQVIQGYGNIDSATVQDKYYTKYQEDLPKYRLKWEEVKPEDKAAALNELVEQYQTQINESLAARITKIDPSIKDTLPIMQDLSNQQFAQGALMPNSKFEYGYDLLTFFDSKNLNLNQLLWVTDFNIVATLDSNTQVIFTSTRDLQEQLTAFETIRRVEDITKARQVDVRANMVSVK